eukprot:scaffold34226_cov44-Attheya_sp.AAC.1
MSSFAPIICTMPSETLVFTSLCDDTIAHILVYVDFPSAIRFSRITSKSLSQRIFPVTVQNPSKAFHHLWFEMFKRHGFSPIEKQQLRRNEIDYVRECRDRRNLFGKLVGHHAKKRNTKISCFNLPNRYFQFFPIVPSSEVYDDWDPPPVDFACRSFILTSTGVGGELLFLDPFDGTVSVHSQVTSNTQKSDAARMEYAMLNAANVIVRHGTIVDMDTDEKEEHIVGDIIDGNSQENKAPPSQVLLDVEHYFNVDLSDYFWVNGIPRGRGDTHMQANNNRNPQHVGTGDDVVIDYIGVDSKPIMDDSSISGNIIAVGRTLSNEAEGFDNGLVCTEILLWRKMDMDNYYKDKFVCRIGWVCSFIELCTKYDRLFVTFPKGNGPVTIENRVMMQEASDEDDEEQMNSLGGGRTIFVYPLVPCKQESQDKESNVERYFPKPLFDIKCTSCVSTVVLDATGETLLVGTIKGTIEVYNLSKEAMATCTHILDVRASVVARATELQTEEIQLKKEACEYLDVSRNDEVVGRTNVENPFDAVGTESAMDIDTCNVHLNLPDIAPLDTDSEEGSDIQMDEGEDVTGFPPLNTSQVIDSLQCPLHLPVDQCGFISLQHHRSDGTTLSLWTHTGKEFHVSSVIDLPLSARKKPRVFYDGRRLVVLGKDDIGMVILVYHVLNSWEDLDYFEKLDKRHISSTRGDESSGVYNLTNNLGRIKFASQIRHAGLGGLENYDSIYMTCNERFIIVNTKTGNLVGGGGESDGLLIINLEDNS